MSEETNVAMEATVREIRRKRHARNIPPRKKYGRLHWLAGASIVLEGMCGEEKIAELCRREGIHQNKYYKWSKEFLKAGKQRFASDTKRKADSHEVEEIRTENEQFKAVVTELMLKNRTLTSALAGGAKKPAGQPSVTNDTCTCTPVQVSEEVRRKSERLSTW